MSGLFFLPMTLKITYSKLISSTVPLYFYPQFISYWTLNTWQRLQYCYLRACKTLFQNMKSTQTVLGLFLAVFLQTSWMSSTKLKFSWSFWGVKPNWFQCYGTNTKKCKKTEETLHKWVVFLKIKKTGNGNICLLCHNLWTKFLILIQNFFHFWIALS